MSIVTPLSEWEYRRGGVGAIRELWREPLGDAFARSWSPVTLPHCVNDRDAVDPDGAYYQGPAWYRCRAGIANPYPNGRTFLDFDGAGQVCSAWVHDIKAGEHAGGYTPFRIDITGPLAARRAPGPVPLAVCCDNSRSVELIPSDLSDFAICGGLYRSVSLRYEPADHWDLATARASLGDTAGGGHVRLEMSLRRAAGKQAAPEITVRVLDPGGSEVAAGRFPAGELSSGPVRRDIAVPSPRPWDVDSPALYEVRFELAGAAGTSTVVRRVGFRRIFFEPHGPFFLNGRRLPLRGTHLHQDHAGAAAAVPGPVARRDFELMKEMGVNFVRLGHYPHAESALTACDELGILAWEEIPWCRGGLGGKKYRDTAISMLGEMVRGHCHHPSVIIWGLGNENDWPGDFDHFDPKAIRRFMGRLHRRAKELDAERFTAIRRCDFCRDVVDVYSPSIWAGWYRGTYTEYEESARRWRDLVPRFLHAEWGGDSHAGRHEETPEATLELIESGVGTDERAGDYLGGGGPARASKDGSWSETYICDLADWHLKCQETMPWLTGSAQWAFKDFATPLRPENPVPHVNQKGLLTRDQQRKEAFYVFQSYWSEKPMVRIYGHDWPVRWGAPGRKRLVRVYSNCPEVTLFLNGRRLGTKKRDSADFPCAGLRWQAVFAPGGNRLEAVARDAAGREWRDRLEFTFQAGAWGPPRRLELREIRRREGGRVVTVEALARDESGLICLDARDIIDFSIAGGGALIDNQGTPWGSRRVQLANGRARISARLDAAAVLGAAVAPLEPAFIGVAPGNRARTA